MTDTSSDSPRDRLDALVAELHAKLDEVAAAADDVLDDATTWVQQTVSQIETKLASWREGRQSQ